MRKHIQKKFLHETEFPPEQLDEIRKTLTSVPVDQIKKIKKVKTGVVTYMTTDDNRFFKTFAYRFNKELKFTPEPDPVLVYFHASYLNYIQIEEKRKEIFEKLSQEKVTEVMINELYDYFSVTSSFAILLFTAIEALMNRCIPIDFTYKRETKTKTELFSKKQIEEFISFDIKLHEVLKEITNKDFSKDYPLKYTHISNLKEFRNMIAHTKETEGHSTYDYLFKKALDFKYADTLNAAKDFCNFYYKPDFVVECSCNQNW
jgi:hypothetical protein